MNFNNVLVEDGRSHKRRTIADGIDFLESMAGFDKSSVAWIKVNALNLPDARVVQSIAMVFDDYSLRKRTILPLCTSTSFHCTEPNGLLQQNQPIELLREARVDYDGGVTLSDRRKVRAVNLQAARLAHTLTGLEERILHMALSMIPGADVRCYRDLLADIPPELRAKMSPLYRLDFSRIIAFEGQPALAAPPLKQIRGRYQDLFPTEQPPTLQTISTALSKCGMRLPHRRTRRIRD